MGPGHRLGNRQGSPGAAPARNENGPGCLARQAFDCARRRGPGPGQVAKITISVAGHRHEYRPAVGAARPRSVRGPQTGRYRGRQRRWPGLSTHRGLGVPTMCSHRHADPGVGQPSGLRVVHLVRHGAGRPPPRQGRRPYRRRRCAPHTDVEPVAWGRPSAGGVGHSTSRHAEISRADIVTVSSEAGSITSPSDPASPLSQMIRPPRSAGRPRPRSTCSPPCTPRNSWTR
jgi:hypothetical protein